MSTQFSEDGRVSASAQNQAEGPFRSLLSGQRTISGYRSATVTIRSRVSYPFESTWADLFGGINPNALPSMLRPRLDEAEGSINEILLRDGRGLVYNLDSYASRGGAGAFIMATVTVFVPERLPVDNLADEVESLLCAACARHLFDVIPDGIAA